MIELTDFDLTVGDEIRFRRKPGGNWQVGRARGVNKDGSLDIGTTTGIRAILPEKVEVKRQGPRGGFVWHPVTTNAAGS